MLGDLGDGPMTFAKITKAMEVTSAYWLKLMPVVRDIVFHYQDIVGDKVLPTEDQEDAEANVKRLTKILSEGKK